MGTSREIIKPVRKFRNNICPPSISFYINMILRYTINSKVGWGRREKL